MKIEEIRTKINSIDAEIVKLFSERMSLSEEVAKQKLTSGKVVRDEEREKSLISALTTLATDDVKTYVPELYERILELSRLRQHEYIRDNAKVGLIGKKLAHSYSPEIHSMLADYDYSLIELEESELSDYFQKRNFTGINVTIPYKKAVIPYLDELTDVAVATGSVNTVINENGKLIGTNTDYFGFSYLLEKSNVSLDGKKCLILGNGGSAATVRAVLSDKNAGQIITVSRSGDDNYTNVSKHFDAEIIINTTPVGMYPNNLEAPLDLKPFTKLEFVLDLIYNPYRTALIMQSEELGIPALNGLPMLVAQAKKSAELFSKVTLKDADIDEITTKIANNQQNIVLIGMPGVGKTTVGKLLAEKITRKFVDIDEEIEKESGKSIPEIFSELGEDGFRALESKTIAKFGKESSLVIATGGGIIKSEQNIKAIKQNAVTVQLKNSLDKLATDGRPLSQDGKALKKLYEERKPIYDKVADINVKVSDSYEETASAILKELL